MRFLVMLALAALLWAASPDSGFGATSTLSARVVAHRVARVYGERHPRIVQLQRTTTDSPPPRPMYFMEIAGHFHRGKRQARFLFLSALVRRWHVWGIVG